MCLPHLRTRWTQTTPNLTSLSPDALSCHSADSTSDDEDSTAEATLFIGDAPSPNPNSHPTIDSPELAAFRQRTVAVRLPALHPSFLTRRSDFPPPFPFLSEDAIMEWVFPRFDGEHAYQRTVGRFLLWLSFLDPESSGDRQKRLCERFQDRYRLEEA
jgi:hypothetical protein